MGCPFNYCRNPEPDCPRCEEYAEAHADPCADYSDQELNDLADYAAARLYGGGR